MTASNRFAKSTRFVTVDGPFANSDTEWEFPEWTVLITDDDGNEYGCYTCRSYRAAIELGSKISVDRRIGKKEESFFALKTWCFDEPSK